MTTTTWIQRKSRLADMIDKAGGVSVGVALAQAQKNLSAMQAQSQSIVAEKVAELSALAAPADELEDMTRRELAYRLSSAVIDAAGPFEMNDLCAAAAGLCDLIDAAPDGTLFDWRIVTVHAQSMRLILALPPEAVKERAQVLDSLKLVLERKLPTQTPKS